MLQVTKPLPLPALPTITTRLATMDDLPFIDRLQKQHSKQLGFFPRAQIEGYVRNGWMRIAEEVASSEYGVAREDESSPSLATHYSSLATPVGYVAFRDRYQKRDELGAVFQLCVDPTRQRGLIGATLLQSAFDASAYGCRLFCCWCAQDLAANKFWEAMGFQAIAFRGGSTKKSRVHIFWQKRIRADDDATPFWFPSKTEGGALREDRLVLPIPPGLRWDEAMPVMVAKEETRERAKRKVAIAPVPVVKMVRTKARFGPPGMFPVPEPAKAVETLPAAVEKNEKPKRTPIDPTLVAAARELRDRYLEHYNAQPTATVAAKYAVGRLTTPTANVAGLLAAA